MKKELKQTLKDQGLNPKTVIRIGLSRFQLSELITHGWVISDNREVIELNWVSPV